MKARKIPVVIDCWDIAAILAGSRPSEVKWALDQGFIKIYPGSITINTLEGEVIGRTDDMLIMGVNKEFYPCKKEIFNKTYEFLD